MKSSEFLNSLKIDTLDINAVVKNDFEHLSATIFNTKPSPEKWSVADCIQHLNQTLEIYIPQMVDAIKEKEAYPKQTDQFKHSLIGRMAVKSMKPKPDKRISFKMKTFGNLKPRYSESNRDEILETFLDFQKTTVEVIEKLKDRSLTKPKIMTAAGPLVKMRIGDALHFIVAHNQRHIVQAQNVLKIIS